MDSIGWYPESDGTHTLPAPEECAHPAQHSFLRAVGDATDAAYLRTALPESPWGACLRHAELFMRGDCEALSSALQRVWVANRGADAHHWLLRLYEEDGDAFALVEFWLDAPPERADYVFAWPGPDEQQILGGGLQVVARAEQCALYARLLADVHDRRNAAALGGGAVELPAASFEAVLDAWTETRQLFNCAPPALAGGAREIARAQIAAFEACMHAHNDAREACGLARLRGLTPPGDASAQ